MNLNKWEAIIKKKVHKMPKIALVLGSGLGNFTEQMQSTIAIPYNELEEFPKSTVIGHKGQFVFGKIEDKDVVAMQGRFHFYEGYPVRDIVLPIRLLGQLGVETFIITNAAGGISETFSPGDLMLITDHINLAGQNPLIGKNDDELGPRFPDMTEAYAKNLRDLAKKVAVEQGIELKEGCYLWMTGPTYETPAEVRMAKILGADAVGMSTVPEVITARHMGLDVLGVSCITNMASGLKDSPLSHEEVVETSGLVNEKFSSLVKEIIRRI